MSRTTSTRIPGAGKGCLTARPPGVRRAFVGAALVLSATAVATSPAHAGPAAPDVPGTVAVTGAFKPYLVTHAVGYQVHTCRIGADGVPRWVFDGPSAQLLDDQGHVVGTHSPGPRWTARDGSTVTGTVVDRATVSTTAIAWLLLRATDPAAGPDGDRLAGTAYIQRINTVGGLTPAASDCTVARAGTTDPVPYTADYVFWKATGSAT